MSPLCSARRRCTLLPDPREKGLTPVNDDIYEAPMIKTVGNVADLTQVTNKNYSHTNDGYTFQGKNINVS